MAEKIPKYPENAPLESNQPNWRIVMAVGTLGIFGEVDHNRLTFLPTEASFTGRISGQEQLSVSQDEYGSSFIDWRLLRSDHDSAATYAIDNTLDAFRQLGMNGMVLSSVFTSDDRLLFTRDAAVALRDMLDITELADHREQLSQLPDSLRSDDFC